MSSRTAADARTTHVSGAEADRPPFALPPRSGQSPIDRSKLSKPKSANITAALAAANITVAATAGDTIFLIWLQVGG